MGQLTQTTAQVQVILDDADAANVGKTSLTDSTDTTAVAVRKSGFYSLGASSSNAPSTDRAILISAVRDTTATGEIRYGQVAITESNGMWWNRDDGGTLGTWYEAVSTAGTQTLTNKTLTSPVLTTPQINDTSADHQYVFAVSELAADRTVTLPLLTGNDTFVFEAHTQTLTNKTLTSPVFNTGVSGTAVLDDDSFLTASSTTLATSESIKAYVDATVTGEDLDFAGDSGTGAVDLDSQTFTIAGTANEIETAASSQTLTIGLPDSVTITTALSVDTVNEKTAAAGVTVDSLLIKDGGITAAGTSTFAGQTISDLGTVTTANIDGGSIDGTTIGASTAAAITGTTGQFDTSLNVDGTVTADGLTVDGATVLDIGDEGTLQVGPTTTAADENQTIEMRGSNGSNELQRFQIANRGEDGTVDFKYGRAGATPTKAISIGSGTGDISFYEDTGTTAKFFWDASAESLGIGTSSPSALLEVNSGNDTLPTISSATKAIFATDNTTGFSSAISIIANATGNADIQFGDYANEDAGIVRYDNANDALVFVTATSERMRIDSSGNVGITASASLRFNGAGDNTHAVGYDSTIDGSFMRGQLGMRFITGTGAGSEAMRIDSSGNLLVGTTASAPNGGEGFKVIPDYHGANKPWTAISTAGYQTETTLSIYSTAVTAYRFYVDAAGTISAVNTTITSLSDERVKENIRDLDDGLAKVMQLQPRKFDWKEGHGKDISNDRGFIAQEFEQVFPDMIEEWKDEAPEGEEPYKAVNANLIPTLVKAIQEQQDLIESLTARIAQLEGAN